MTSECRSVCSNAAVILRHPDGRACVLLNQSLQWSQPLYRPWFWCRCGQVDPSGCVLSLCPCRPNTGWNYVPLRPGRSVWMCPFSLSLPPEHRLESRVLCNAIPAGVRAVRTKRKDISRRIYLAVAAFKVTWRGVFECKEPDLLIGWARDSGYGNGGPAAVAAEY